MKFRDWQQNVYVKIPITNSRGESSISLIRELAEGCDIVTVPHDILGKALKLVGMGLEALSLDTVRMFAQDAEKAGFKL